MQAVGKVSSDGRGQLVDTLPYLIGRDQNLRRPMILHDDEMIARSRQSRAEVPKHVVKRPRDSRLAIIRDLER